MYGPACAALHYSTRYLLAPPSQVRQMGRTHLVFLPPLGYKHEFSVSDHQAIPLGATIFSYITRGVQHSGRDPQCQTLRGFFWCGERWWCLPYKKGCVYYTHGFDKHCEYFLKDKTFVGMYNGVKLLNQIAQICLYFGC